MQLLWSNHLQFCQFGSSSCLLPSCERKMYRNVVYSESTSHQHEFLRCALSDVTFLNNIESSIRSGCCTIDEFVCYTLKFAYLSPKQTDLSSIHKNLAQNPRFLIGNWHCFRVLICNIIMPLVHCMPLSVAYRNNDLYSYFLGRTKSYAAISCQIGGKCYTTIHGFYLAF